MSILQPLPDGYYAVPDPDDPTTITCWRVKDDDGRALTPSPTGAHYGPTLYRRDVPKELKANAKERALWVNTWFIEVRGPWDRKVREAIAADPEAAGLRFADHTHHCCRCNKPLTVSAFRGVGADCAEAIQRAAARGAVLADTVTVRQRAVVDRLTRTDAVLSAGGDV